MLKRLFKKTKTMNYQYAILESSGMLHPAETLEVMLRNAENDYQKSAILNHIVRFEEITMQFPDYRKIYNRIFDEYSKK